MKNRLAVFLFIGGLLGNPVLATVDIAGIVQTGNTEILMDSITWYLISSPFPVTESTPGWGGPAGTTDTYQLAPKNEWPQWAELYYRVNGIPNRMVLNPILPDTWYELLTLDNRNAMVRFEDTLFPQGLNTAPRAQPNRKLFIFPNPVRDGLLRLEPVVDNVEIYDIIGNRYPIHLTRDSYGVTLNISKLRRGIYLLRSYNGGFESTTKILKLQ